MSTSRSEGSLLDALCAAPLDRTFVTMWEGEEEHSVTFGEFIERARAHAATFNQHHLAAGDTVILILPQGIEVMAAFAGAMMLGAIPTILAYPNFKVEPSKYRSGLAGVSANLGAKLTVVDAAFPDDLLDYVHTDSGAAVVRSAGVAAPAADLPHLAIDPDATAFIQHSAGTTGLQKGVALSHAAVLRQIEHLADAIRLTSDDRIFSWLPLYHDMGLIACFVMPMVRHVHVVMQSPSEWVMQPVSMLELVMRHRCTVAWVPNFTLQFLARRVHAEDREQLDLSSLRALINCSEPVRSQSIDEFAAIYRPRGLGANALQTSYAMAENVFAVTQSNVVAPPVRIHADLERLRRDHIAVDRSGGGEGTVTFVSSGRALPGNEVLIAGDGTVATEGQIGEILVRSDSLFTGYFNRPDLTEQALRDGWYRTGDLGFYVGGELFVVGRKKDLIIVAGKNIYPQDVEEIVCAQPEVHDGRAVALGLFNDDLGTDDIVVVAEVNGQEYLDQRGSIAIEQRVRAAIVAELGVAPRAVYLKQPRWIVKSTAGKPARSATREKLLAEHPELSSANDTHHVGESK